MKIIVFLAILVFLVSCSLNVCFSLQFLVLVSGACFVCFLLCFSVLLFWIFGYL